MRKGGSGSVVERECFSFSRQEKEKGDVVVAKVTSITLKPQQAWLFPSALPLS